MRLFAALIAAFFISAPIAVFAEPLAPKSIYITQEPLTGTLYVGQVVAVSYNAVITETSFDRLETKIETSAGIRRLSGELRWRTVDENRRRLTVFYQITAPRASLPQVTVSLYLLNGEFDEALVAPSTITAQRVGANPQFSGVLADDLTVITHKVERFNDTQNIVAMEIKAEISNLSQFSLSEPQTQGIDWTEVRLPTTRIFYYALVPLSQTELSFNYFQPKSGDFKRINIAFDLSNLGQRISTHTDINPNKRAFPWIKVLLLSLTMIALIAIFVKTRKWIFLALAAVVGAITLWIVFHDESIVIRSGAEIRLLPTDTSTRFYVTTEPTLATLLKEKTGYYKVLLPDGKIGWVKQGETE
ncbi:hypothetical protein AGMMS49521_2730 [Campylobacterota bacterium]|nr:hypothetical protein AGMMS49521_2730 [Campylobacterota bacterium]